MFAVLCVLLTISSLMEQRSIPSDMLLFWRRSKGGAPCIPFTEYDVLCNKCVCAADGVPSCTRMDCRKIETSSDDTVDPSSN